MEIKDLSLSDLKAAYDFVLLDLKDLEKAAKSENIPAYAEVKTMEGRLWTELLNRTRNLNY